MDPLVRTRLDLSAGDGATLAMIHEFGRVLSTRYEENRVVVEAEVPESLERRLQRPLDRASRSTDLWKSLLESRLGIRESIVKVNTYVELNHPAAIRVSA